MAHDTSTEYINGYTKIGRVEIGDNVYIGYNTIILCNVKIGSNVIIGAVSVVTKDISDNKVCAGNPARFIWDLETFKKKHELNINNCSVFKGPCAKWKEKDLAIKEDMKNDLINNFGYMK